MATNPSILNYQALQRLQVPDQSQVQQMPQAATPPVPNMPPPVAPSVSLRTPTAEDTTQTRLLGDQNELQRISSTGSGISQIKNPLLRGLARAGDIAESVFLPGAEALTPGTEGNHQRLLGQQSRLVNNDLSSQQQEAQNQDLQAQGQQRQALAQQEQAKAQSLMHPKGGLLYDKNGSPIGYQDPQGKYYAPGDPNLDPGVNEVLHAAQRKQPTNAFELWQQQNPKGTAEQYLALSKPEKDATLQQQLLDAIGTGDNGKADNIRKVINDTQVQPKITVLNAAAANRADAASTKAETVKTAKVGSDEQKRADLAENLNENINALEEIAGRRPELFGPIGGRLTDAKTALGTSDPDIAQLQVIKHQLGMVAQGAHGMRSAQGVESAANSLVNGYHNSPQALKAGLEAARGSTKTFLNDANNPGASRGDGEAPAASYSTTATGPNGHKIGSNDGGKTWVDLKTGKAI